MRTVRAAFLRAVITCPSTFFSFFPSFSKHRLNEAQFLAFCGVASQIWCSLYTTELTCSLSLSPVCIMLLPLHVVTAGRSYYYEEGNGSSLQYSCLENPMDGGAWWATVHGVAKSPYYQQKVDWLPGQELCLFGVWFVNVCAEYITCQAWPCPLFFFCILVGCCPSGLDLCFLLLPSCYLSLSFSKFCQVKKAQPRNWELCFIPWTFWGLWPRRQSLR